MPPYIRRKCPHCQHLNTFDLAQLQMEIYKGPEDKERRYPVTCKECLKSFNAIVKEGQDDAPTH